MRARRTVAAMAVAVAAVTAVGACGGESTGAKAGKTITDPIDKARSTADKANQRGNQIDPSTSSPADPGY